jgi:hypothetical protein
VFRRPIAVAVRRRSRTRRDYSSCCKRSRGRLRGRSRVSAQSPSPMGSAR